MPDQLLVSMTMQKVHRRLEKMFVDCTIPIRIHAAIRISAGSMVYRLYDGTRQCRVWCKDLGHPDGHALNIIFPYHLAWAAAWACGLSTRMGPDAGSRTGPLPLSLELWGSLHFVTALSHAVSRVGCRSTLPANLQHTRANLTHLHRILYDLMM